MAMGRPPIYTPELAEAVCEAVAAGKTIRTIEAMAGMPSWTTIRKWLLTKDDFASLYARAYEASATTHENEAFDRIRDAQTPEDAAVARVFLDAVKWSNGKRNPRVYGEKTTHDVRVSTPASVADDAALLAIAFAGRGSGAATEGDPQ